ncbi:MAG: YncE family protein, partial [Bacteroidota bacterium]
MKKLCMYFFVAVAILLVGCERSNDQGENFDYSSGTLLVNEGSFGNSNGSISWYSNGTVKNGIFEDVNGSVLGDVIMDADRVNALTYVVSNNSQKVVVLKSASFEYVNAISGFEYPRHFLKISDSEAAVSDGSGAGSVKWIDLNSSTISSTTAVGNGPEEMLLSAGKLFVCNSGGWGIDNTISVIDVATKQVINTVVVENRPVE